MKKTHLSLLLAGIAMFTGHHYYKATSTTAPTLTIQDQSGSGEVIYWGIIGLGNTDSANWYYLDHTTQSVTITTKGQQLGSIFTALTATTTINLPKLSSARVYFAVGQPLTSTPFASAADIVLPNFIGADPNSGIIYDKFEFTYNDSMGFVNTTLVDYFAIPMGVTLTGNQKGIQNLGRFTSPRDTILGQMAASSAQYAALVVTSTAYAKTKYIRGVSPIAPSANYVAKGAGLKFDADEYYGFYIDSIWSAYSKPGRTWDINLQAAYGVSATGRVIGKDFVFADTAGKTYTITKPSGFDLLGCTGVFVPVTYGAGVYPQIDGIIKRDVAAAMNRSVAQAVSQDKCGQVFYTQTPYNEYAKVVHANSYDGLNYAFPYDDVCDGSSGMGDTEPVNITATLLPW